MKLASKSKPSLISNKIRESCHNQSHKWRWLPNSKQLWSPCKAMTHSSRTFSWCITILKFFQTAKWCKAITNKWSWFRMLKQPKLTDSSNNNNNQWCSHKCQLIKSSQLIWSPNRTSNQCKITKAKLKPQSPRCHWRLRKLNKKRERLLFWMKLSHLTNFKTQPRLQPQARTSSSSLRKYLSPASHQRSELTPRSSNSWYLVRNVLFIIFKKHQVTNIWVIQI